ncbi:MAG: hypothetical protein AB7U83_23445 [Vicinamibacterales bacterium]
MTPPANARHALVGRQTLAAVLGVSLRTVSDLEAAGVVVPARRGRGGRKSLYDLVYCVPAYIATLKATAPATETLTTARQRVAALRATVLQQQIDRHAGKVVSIDAARREAFESGRTIRTLLEALPARLSHEIAACSDPARVFQILDGAIRDALTTIADALDAPDDPPADAALEAALP